jgi:LCP family protein required for cell wall assembly
VRQTTTRVLALTAMLAACTSQATPTTPAPSTITKPPVTTPATTAAPPFEVSGAPPELTALVHDTYLQVGERGGILAGPIAAAGGPGLPPAQASVAVYRGVGVAVVETDRDVLAAVDEGGGWRWVAGRVGGTSVLPSLPGVYAVIGSDARSGEDPTRSRADSLHLVGIDGAGGARMVGIPRDSWVPGPDGRTGKINGTLAAGGPDALIATIQGLAGYPIDGYVLTGFDGFQEMVGNILGGVLITVEAPMNDRASGALFSVGEMTMNGTEALAFSRNRKGLADGDFGRQRNGGVMLLAGIVTAKLRGPLSVPDLLAASEPWLYTNLSPAQLLELSLAVHLIDPLSVSNEVLPGRSDTRGAASVVILGEGSAGILAGLPGAG